MLSGLRRLRFSHFGRRYLLVTAFDASSEERAGSLGATEASDLFGFVHTIKGADDVLDRFALVDLAMEVGALDSVVPSRTTDEVLHETVTDALRFGRLLIIPEQPARAVTGAGGGAPTTSAEPAPSGAPAASTKKLSWIGVKIIDEAERPVAGVAVRISGSGVLRDAATTTDGVVLAADIEDGNY